MKHERRRRHGQGNAGGDGGPPGPAQAQSGEGDDRGGDDDLQGAQPKDGLAQFPKLRGLEFKTDDEQHDDHAELGEVHDVGAFGADDAEHRRTDQNSRDEVTENGTKAQAGGDRHRENGSRKIDKGAEKKIVQMHGVSPPSRLPA